MQIQLAETDRDIERCFPVMVQLRPHLAADEFLDLVRRMMEGGYHLAYIEDVGTVQAVAGFRILEMLSRGRFMYVDDLVTDAAARSRGYGDALFDWLAKYAHSHACEQLELDSGVQRFGAHRFYFRKRMHIASYHFSLQLGG
jgi:GNAT superfamily N-acetyltransferase